MRGSKAGVLAALLVGAAACGPPVDPRCASLCQYKGPAGLTYGGYCNQASADRCADSCTVRIKDLATVCQSCLLERARFFAFEVSAGSSCGNGTCTVGGGSNSCQYTAGNTDQEQACLRQVYPLTAVDCTPEFRPVTDCAAVCAAPR